VALKSIVVLTVSSPDDVCSVLIGHLMNLVILFPKAR
jgi:hypothetical protein